MNCKVNTTCGRSVVFSDVPEIVHLCVPCAEGAHPLESTVVQEVVVVALIVVGTHWARGGLHCVGHCTRVVHDSLGCTCANTRVRLPSASQRHNKTNTTVCVKSCHLFNVKSDHLVKVQQL